MAVWPESTDVGAIETERVGLTVTVTVVVATPARESVTCTQKVVVDVSETVVYESDETDWRGVPVHALPEYQLYSGYAPEPPDATPVSVAA